MKPDMVNVGKGVGYLAQRLGVAAYRLLFIQDLTLAICPSGCITLCNISPWSAV